MSNNGEGKGIIEEFKDQIAILGGLVILAWGVEIVNLLLFHDKLDTFGIYPRSVPGLIGILFAPFLHGGFWHLLGNTIPFVTLGWLVMLRNTSDFFVVSIVAALVGGLGTWLIGSPGYHIGASGVIFGYLGYLLARGYFERSIVSIGFSLFVGMVYGSMLWGVFPMQRYVSWEGHLCGFIGGVIAAWLLTGDRQKT
jgi:membrane associated rhomboid family serine protease